jgi:hypothetical protein
LVRSYAHPEGDLTGITTFASNEIVAESIALSNEAVPSLTRSALAHREEKAAGQNGGEPERSTGRRKAG